ncbi:MAG: hypothetical protein R6U22_03645 [Desulfohalobiaceae bacterium]
MFCNKCKFTSFDQLESCPACGSNWQQIKRELNLDWLQGSYPVQSQGYQAHALGLEQQAEAQGDHQTQVKDEIVDFAYSGAPQETELEFNWEDELGPSRPDKGFQAAQQAQTGQQQAQEEDIAFPDLEDMFETGQKTAASGLSEDKGAGADSGSKGVGASEQEEGQQSPGLPKQTRKRQAENSEPLPDQEGLEFELEPEGEEVDISALFDELESDLDSRRKKG